MRDGRPGRLGLGNAPDPGTSPYCAIEITVAIILRVSRATTTHACAPLSLSLAQANYALSKATNQPAGFVCASKGSKRNGP